MFHLGLTAVMAINRRQFLQHLLAGLVLNASPLVSAQHTSRPLMFASASRFKQQYWLHLLTENGTEKVRHLLPKRAHQIVVHPHKPWLLAVSRRPGTSMDCVNYETGALIKRIECAPHQHLYGHAQFSADGRYLWSTENDMRTHEGLVVVRDAHNHFAIQARWLSGGVGPHELRLMPDQRTLVVANGGIKTQGRTPINLDSMQPSLVYLDTHTGRQLEHVSLAPKFHQCSIRHLDVSAQGRVLVALQYKGDMADKVPLIVQHTQGQALQTLAVPDDEYPKLRHYCGSACFDSTGELAAVSAPRGDRILFWSAAQGRYLGTTIAKDGCGLAATQQPFTFMVSTGRGKWYKVDALSGKKQRISLPDSNIEWDNHLTAVAAHSSTQASIAFT